MFGGVLGHGKGYSLTGFKTDQKWAYSNNSGSRYKRTSYIPPLNRPGAEGVDCGQRQTSSYLPRAGSRQSATGSYNPNQDKSSTSNGASEKKREGRIFSNQEYLNRKAKGLCLKCGEPFNPMHRCANKSMRILFYVDDEEGSEELEDEMLEEQAHVEPTVVNQAEYGTLELPLFSVGGVNRPQTMKFKGRLGNVEVVVMVDGGASHNFVLKN